MVAPEKKRRRIDELLIESATLRRQAITETVGEARILLGKPLQVLCYGAGIEPRPDRDAEPAIIPPGRMHARENLQDVLALLRCWRQGPCGDGHVRVGQIFEQ